MDKQDAINFLESFQQTWVLPGGWGVEDLGDGSIQVKTAVGEEFHIPQTEDDWHRVLGENIEKKDKSYSLWLTSLEYLPRVKEIDRGTAARCLNTFYLIFPVYRSRLEKNLVGSWDHCVAMRLLTLTLMVDNFETEEDRRILELLNLELDAADFSTLIGHNNHGLMLADAVATAGIAQIAFGVDAGESLVIRARDEMQNIIRAVFGSDYFCNENSSIYHLFYVNLLKKIVVKYQAVAGLKPMVDFLESQISKIESTLSLLCFPDGTLPPFGDSNPVPTKVPSINGTHYSVRTGIWVWKNDSLYVSLKCGHDSLTHKHSDDSSVVLKRGEDIFFTDAGSGNYNYSDPLIFMLRTQRGHSGVYFEKFDNLHPASLHKNGYAAQGRIYPINNNEVRCSYTISGENFVSRSIEVRNQSTLFIEDCVYSVHKDSFVHRFIIPEDISVATEANRVILQGSSYRLVLEYEPHLELQMSSGQLHPPHKGWVSTKPNEVQIAKCLEFLNEYGLEKSRFSIAIEELSTSEEEKR